jgi:hypothetical protein
VRIAIAAWHLKNPNVGIGRYARELIDALGRVDRTSHYEILIPCAEHPFTPRPNMRYRVVRFPLFRRRVWEQVAPLLAGPYDVLYFPTIRAWPGNARDLSPPSTASTLPQNLHCPTYEVRAKISSATGGSMS